MKKILSLFLLLIFLSGCATYKFQKGAKAPYDKGYVVSRDNYTIAEYTAGENNSVPDDMKLAKERFRRRRNIVEDYYKKMNLIQNRFKENFTDRGITFMKLVGGVFRLPFIIVSNYRYETDPKYKARIDKLEAEADAAEEARQKELREGLNAYIQQDLAKEKPSG